MVLSVNHHLFVIPAKAGIHDGRVFTMDALNTHRKTAETILNGGGDYVMIVKENQSGLLDDVRTVFDGPCWHLLSVSETRGLYQQDIRLSMLQVKVRANSGDQAVLTSIRHLFWLCYIAFISPFAISAYPTQKTE